MSIQNSEIFSLLPQKTLKPKRFCSDCYITVIVHAEIKGRKRQICHGKLLSHCFVSVKYNLTSLWPLKSPKGENYNQQISIFGCTNCIGSKALLYFKKP